MRIDHPGYGSSRHHLRRTVIALLTMVITVFGIALVNAPAASAESSSTPTAQFPWAHNGCTGVPDDPSGVSFTAACNYHDGCYGGHWASRSTCDLIFLGNMIKACNAQWYYHYNACRAWALIYYAGVRIFGQPFYDAGGTSRINTPMQA